MDYKEKYEQALENIKKIKNANKDNKELVDFIEYKYPELMSEDERIRKELVRAFTVTANKRDSEIYGNGITYGQVLDWLEKQKDYEDELEKAYKCADEVQYRKGFEDGVTSVKSTEWSEEDENMCKSIITTCELAEQDRNSSPAKHLLEMQTNWLKSLKQRMKGETK